MLQLATLIVQAGHAVGELLQHRQGLILAGLGRCVLLIEVDQAGFVRSVQSIAVGQQALPAHTQSTALLFDVALVSRQNLDLLLHLRHAATLFIGRGLCGTQRFFERRQPARLFFVLGRQQLGMLLGLNGLRAQAVGFHSSVGLAR